MVGHGVPGDIAIAPGHLLHIDFGVRYHGYCSDLQRCWYVPRPGEVAPPAPVQAAFDTVANAIQAAARQVRPGICGWELDEVARQTVTELVIHPTIMRWAIRSAGRRMTAVRSSARSGHAMARHHAYRWKPAMSSRSNRALTR